MSNVEFEAADDIKQGISDEAKKRTDKQETRKALQQKAIDTAKEAAEAARKVAKEAAKKAKAAQAELDQIKEEQRLERSIEIWRQVTKIREDADQAIQELIKAEPSKLIGISKTKVKGDFNKYYTYQHPGEKKGILRGNDENATWIKTYLEENPKHSLADLIAQADKSRIKSFIATFKREKIENKEDSKKKTKEEPAIDTNKRDQ